MEAKLAAINHLKSMNPKSPASPSGRSFNAVPPRNSSNFLSPESALDADRSAINKSNPSSPIWSAHAPSHSIGGNLAASDSADVRGANRTALNRTKSVDYSSVGATSALSGSRTPHLSQHFEDAPEGGQGEQENPPVSATLKSPMVSTSTSQLPLGSTLSQPSWASMMNTPLMPGFDNKTGIPSPMTVENATQKLASWNLNNGLDMSGRVVLDDPRKYRRRNDDSNPISPVQPHSAVGNLGQWPLQTPITPLGFNNPLDPHNLNMMNINVAQQMQQMAALNGAAVPGMNLYTPSSNALVNAQAQMIALSMMNQQLAAQQAAGGPQSARSFGGTPTRRSPMRSINSPKAPDAPVDENVLSDIPAWFVLPHMTR